MTQQITITKPDDWHLHVRDGAALNTVVPHTAAEFGRAPADGRDGVFAPSSQIVRATSVRWNTSIWSPGWTSL